MIDDDFSFGTLLHTLRRCQHLTQQELARSIGVHRRTLVRWEQGDSLPESKALVLELAHHLKLGEQQTRQLLEASLTALAPYWFVPLPRNPFFSGRETILSELHTRLCTGALEKPVGALEKPVGAIYKPIGALEKPAAEGGESADARQAVALTQSSALHGLGGVGKTQIALEYAYRYVMEYSAVFWIGAETDEQITASLLNIAEVLRLPEQADKDQQRVIAAVQQWLSMHNQWLLIWDNVEDLDVLARFLPARQPGVSLITTRHRATGTLAYGLELAPMEQEESILFLLCRAKLLSPEATSEHLCQYAACQPAQYAAVSELVMALGGLPLALDQVGAYIEETQCMVSAYLDLFHTRRAALLQQRGQGSRDHPASVSTTLMLTIVATAERHPAVWDLLRVCALLQADAIPEEVFCQGGERLGAALATACHDLLEWDRIVGIACSYSLLSRQPEERTLSLHRLVRAVLLDSMSEAEREQWGRRTLRVLDAVFPEALSTTAYEIWKQCERLLPHALLCLRQTETTQDALVCASLAYKVARYQWLRGQYREAEPLYRRALDIRERELGPEHPLVADVLDSQANLCWRQGNYAQAETLYQRALHIRECALGPTHPEVATTINGLANLYSDVGRYQEIEALRRRALRILERALGPEHPEVALVLNNLAVLYLGQSRYAEAEACCQRALCILEQALGPDHPQVAYPLYLLGEISREQGRYVEAERFHERALRIREQKLGPDHPLLAVALSSLANLYREQGRCAEAEPLHQRALRIQEQSLGPDHPLLAGVLNSLAHLYREQGRYVEAEALYQRALHIREQYLGSFHADTAEVLHGLALLRHRQGRLNDALALAERVRSIRVQTLVVAHVDTAEILHDLALFRQQQGELNEALALARQALAIRRQVLGDVHTRTIATGLFCAQLLQKQAETAKKAPSGQDTLFAPYEEFQAHESESPLRGADDASSSANDPLHAFLEACCTLHPRACCRSAELWQAYTHWAQEQQVRYPLSRGAFSEQLKAHGYHAYRSHNARLWRGIATANMHGD